MNLKIFKDSLLTSRIILSVLVIGLEAISIPISTQESRCMVVYSSSTQQNIKIDVRFPTFPKQDQHDEYFMIWINNTETFQADFYRVQSGNTYRRQLELEANVMYKVCFKLNTTSGRQIGPVDVQYEAYHQFRIMNHERHNIKVPDSILMQNDFRESYNDVLLMLDMTERQLSLNDMHKKDELRHFEVINATTQNLIWISVVQIVFICAVAMIQFLVIKKHLAGELRL